MIKELLYIALFIIAIGEGLSLEISSQDKVMNKNHGFHNELASVIMQKG